jgi:hypothetical protein
MGLDMSLYGVKFFWSYWDHPENNRMEDGLKVSSLEVELGYWRKHPNLHGFIVQTFAGGVDKCQRIELDEKQLRQTLEAVLADELPHTEGFFFGESQSSDKGDSIKQLKAAIEWLMVEEKGVSRSVYYRASW